MEILRRPLTTGVDSESMTGKAETDMTIVQR